MIFFSPNVGAHGNGCKYIIQMSIYSELSTFFVLSKNMKKEEWIKFEYYKLFHGHYLPCTPKIGKRICYLTIQLCQRYGIKSRKTTVNIFSRQ